MELELADFSSSRADILALYDKTQKKLENDLEILREWMAKQPHLPIEHLQDEFLEIFLIKNKFSIEKTKSKIENYCTLKGLKRFRYFYDSHIYVPSEEPQFLLPIPVLTDDFRRVFIEKILDPEKWDLQRDFSNALLLREFLARFDYNDGEIVVYDLTECSVMLLSKLRANVMVDMTELVLKGHSAKIKEIHLISKFASAVFNWTKPFLPSKIASRVMVHDSLHSLNKFLPAKCLPRDYGGELRSLDEFRRDFDRIYTNHREDLLLYLNTKSREELRQGYSPADEMQGTFRQLDID